MTASAKAEGPRLSGTNLERAADHNQRVTLHAVRVLGPLTRVDLARITGLTGPAIANITKRLLQEGLINEAGQRRGGRGQPPTKLVVRADACHSLGLNIDRDHVTMVLVDFAGNTLARVSKDIDFAMPDTVQALYRASVQQMLRKAGVADSSIVGIGVAMPDDLWQVDMPRQPAEYGVWRHTDIANLLAEPLAAPVFVENDAAAAAMGEMQLGLGHSNNSFFYMLISSGLGGGLVVDGNYIRGATGRSGELGFMVGDDGVQIQRTVSIAELARRLAGIGLTLADLRRQPEAATAIVDNWIADAAEGLVVSLDAINCLINPAAVLIGGRLPADILDRLAERINRCMADRAAGLPSLAPVMRAALSDDAPAVGAAILPFSHFLLPRQGALWTATAKSG